MIQLKGRQAGVLKCIVPDDTNEEEMLKEFVAVSDRGQNFLDGFSLVIDMQGRRVSPSLVFKIWDIFFEPSGCSVSGWIINDSDSKCALEHLGLSIIEDDSDISSLQGTGVTSRSETTEKGFLYSGNLRSGQSLSHSGDIIVLGHVNRGAEVKAGGHIVVLGRLSGLVHAGCDGDNNMSVSARAIEAGQIRIGSKVGIIETDSDFWGKSTVVTVINDEVTVTDWPII